MGRPEEMQSALDRGRAFLEALPYPDNIENHFVLQQRYLGEPIATEYLEQLRTIRSPTASGGRST